MLYSLNYIFYLIADASVFRERSRVPLPTQQQQQALAEKFLRAIEDEREREEEEEYKNQLRNLWNRYQVEEGDIEKELFDNDIEANSPLGNEGINRKRNRQVTLLRLFKKLIDNNYFKQNSGDGEVALYYSNDKRFMPMLPWLPASRKKRFPVTKRSSKTNGAPETPEKVSQDLTGIFGTSTEKSNVDDNKVKTKRSSDATHPLLVENAKKAENSQTKSMFAPMAEKKRKREVSDPDDEDETDNENEEEGTLILIFAK